ncbi:MAG: helix-turn-helix transcriptional regulator [Planctomycetia bacterium]|nr:helix-turn-helix transcriptional regulator [Planctomycetia bacterium]
MSFKNNLKAMRVSAGLTQLELARKAGVPFRTYQNWETGVREPRLQALVALAAAFGITVDQLLQASGLAAVKPAPGASSR